MALNQYIDHTLLKPTSNESDYIRLCHEALEYNFKAVCVPPSWVKLCKEKLANSSVLTATVVGFPLGYSLTSSKEQEIKALIEEGVDEIDFVTNISWVKSGHFDLVKNEFKRLRDASGNVVVKAILETGALTESEIKKLCHIAVDTKLDFIKTSTGFSEVGAKISDVALMKKEVGNSILIKSSGGIKDFETAKQFIQAGADRIGCSASVNILKESDGTI